MSLSDIQKKRYNRNILVNGIGEKGQEKLLASKVLVIGAGGLGSPNLLYLAAAGIGTIGIADGDTVEISNLQRQVVHHTPDIGRPKVDSAKKRIEDINPDVKVITYYFKVTPENIADVIKGYDFIIECTDGFAAKFLINDACVLNKKPFSHCGVLSFYGQMITYLPGCTCLRCMFSSLPAPGTSPTSSEAGIFSTVPGTFGTLQASEAVKYLLGNGRLLTDTLFYFDIFNFEVKSINIKPNPKCPICGNTPTITTLTDSNYL